MKKVGLESLIVRQEGFDRFSRPLLEARQLELLNVQLARAKKISSFYSEYPEALHSLSELSELPFTTADMLKNEFSKLCLIPPSDFSRVRTEPTSGTTGGAKRIIYSEYDSNRTLDFFENGLGELIYPGDVVLICMPYTDSLSLGGLIAQAVTRLGAIPVNGGSFRTYGDYVAAIEDSGASVYIGPPVLLLSLLRLMDNKLYFKRALVSGDLCSETVAEKCEELMGSRLFPHYGLRESGLGCACTCSAHAGMHIRENDIICEITDASGNVLPRGELGELVITTIGLDAMPLFRYKTGDFARLIPGVCPCGSEVLRMEVCGRIQNGIGIGYYDDLLFVFDEIIDFKITGNTVTIAVTDPGDALQKAVSKRLRGFDIIFQKATLDSFPMYQGKRRIT